MSRGSQTFFSSNKRTSETDRAESVDGGRRLGGNLFSFKKPFGEKKQVKKVVSQMSSLRGSFTGEQEFQIDSGLNDEDQN